MIPHSTPLNGEIGNYQLFPDLDGKSFDLRTLSLEKLKEIAKLGHHDHITPFADVLTLNTSRRGA